MNPRKKPLSRRSFLGLASLAAAPLFIPASALGRQDGKSAASERIVMAFIGCGAMGKANYSAFRADERLQVAAVADPDSQRAAEFAGTVASDYGDPAITSDFREILARKDIDAVCIAVPDHWHAPIAIAAARAGKDVYLEKPLALTIEQGQRIVSAVDRYGTVLQVGSQQRSVSNFRRACELVRNGVLGDLQRVVVGIPPGPAASEKVEFTPPPPHLDYEMWLGPAPYEPYTPQRCHWNFRWNFDYSGGMVTDWGAHHVDIAHWGLGMDRSGPIRIDASGQFLTTGIWNTPSTYEFRLDYDGAASIEVNSSNRRGIRFEGKDGTLFVNRETIEGDPASLLTASIGPNGIRLPASPGHQRNFIDCVLSRAEPIVPAAVGHRSITACHLANISMRLGRPLEWDPVREQFPNDPEASRWISRPMRAPWRLG